MTKSTPVRIDATLYTAAQQAASTMGRSAAQQVAHWARIGRELEASPRVSVRRVAEVLEGGASYDALSEEEQALVRGHWSERIDARAESLRLDRQFAEEGRSWAELDDEGRVVRRTPTPRAKAARAG